jgi:hypothetical protein
LLNTCCEEYGACTYVDRLQDENDELRKLMGWLSGHEPQFRIMIETYKRRDGKALGAKKAGEGSGESDILEPPKTHHKNAFVHKLNHLSNRLDTTPAPPVFPPQTDNVTPDFLKKTKCKPICMPGSSFMHIVTNKCIQKQYDVRKRKIIRDLSFILETKAPNITGNRLGVAYA